MTSVSRLGCLQRAPLPFKERFLDEAQIEWKSEVDLWWERWRSYFTSDGLMAADRPRPLSHPSSDVALFALPALFCERFGIDLGPSCAVILPDDCGRDGV
ncbi:hypothetical protein C5688_20820 [Methylocystis sp. MitZ-2018]|nr:hypothetical protein C5688_20820 [Methylocystis sp. MitZ-2018]